MVRIIDNIILYPDPTINRDIEGDIAGFSGWVIWITGDKGPMTSLLTSQDC